MNTLALLLAYLLGSIPFGYLIVKLSSGADIRKTGSGGTGATNVSRKAGKVAGVVTLALDALKGAAAVLVARWLTGEAGTSWVVAAAAALAVFIVVVWRTRYVSLGSIIAAAFLPLWILLTHTWIEPVGDFAPIMTALCAVSAVIIFKHSENIKRLMAGEENKFGVAR